MPVNKPNSRFFGKLTKRQTLWLINELASLGILNCSTINLNFDQQKLALDEAIRNHKLTGREHAQHKSKEAYCRDLLVKCSNELVIEPMYGWINQQDERLCYWLWLYTSLFDWPSNGHIGNQITNRRLEFYGKPKNDSKHRVTDFTAKFDIEWKGSIELKTFYMQQLKSMWSEIFQNQNCHKWLDKKNEKQIDWAWSNLSSSIVASGLHRPTNTNDKYLALVSSMDVMFVDQRDKLFYSIDKSKRAWSTKKNRDAKIDKTTLTFSVSKDAALMLKKIVETRGIKRDLLIEGWISREHNEI